jgi:hypothetical protein
MLDITNISYLSVPLSSLEIAKAEERCGIAGDIASRNRTRSLSVPIAKQLLVSVPILPEEGW